MPGIMYTPPHKPGGGADDDDVMEIFEDDVMEEIDIDENAPAEQLMTDMNEMDLENYDADGDELVGEEDDGEPTMPARDDAEVVFDKHTGSVFTVRLQPGNASLAVTGGEDDKAYVWKTNNGEVLFECEGHKDSVTEASFSHDGKFVATGDMSGIIKVWNVKAQKEKCAFEVSDLEWMEWHHSSHALLAGTVDGTLWLWNIKDGSCKTFPGNDRSCSVGKFMPKGPYACAGYEDGTVKLWDLKNSKVAHNFPGTQSNSQPVTCMDVCGAASGQETSLVAMGSVDAHVRLFTMDTGAAGGGKLATTLDCNSEAGKNKQNSVETVGFHASESWLATGTLVGTLGVWDVRTQQCRHELQHAAGIVRLRWDSTSAAPHLYTCTLDGTCHLWDTRSGKAEATWMGHSEEVLAMDLAKDVMVTGSGDKTARVFSLHTPDR